MVCTKSIYRLRTAYVCWMLMPCMIFLSCSFCFAKNVQALEMTLQSGPGNTAIFSPDGKYVLSGNKLLDIETCREIRAYKDGTFKISADGKYVLAINGDRLSYLDITSGVETKSITFKRNISTVFALSSDGRYLISIDEEYPNSKIVVWDASTGNQLKLLAGHTARVNCLTFSPDGKYLLSGSADMTLRLWDIVSGKFIRRFEGHYSDVTCAAFSPDGKFILSGGADKVLELWDVSTGKEIRILEGHTADITSVAFSKNGKFALSGGDTILFWDVFAGKQLKWASGQFKNVNGVGFSADGKYAFGIGLASAGDYYQGTMIKIWDAASRRELRTFSSQMCSPGLDYPIAVSRNGKYFVTGGEGLRLWDVATGKQLRKISCGVVTVLAFSPDNRHVLCYGGWKDREVKLWDVLSGNFVKTIKVSGSVCSLAFSSDGSHVLLGEGDRQQNGAKTIRLIELGASAIIKSFEQIDSFYPIFAVFSPNGRSVITGNYGGVKEYDAVAGKDLKVFQQQSKLVKFKGPDPSYETSVAFSPDGKYVLSGGSCATLWDASTGSQIRQFGNTFNQVDLVEFSPDGKHAVIAGSESKTNKHIAEYWDLVTWKVVRTLEYDPLNPIVFSPDGRYMTTSGFSPVIWDLVSGRKMVDRSCWRQPFLPGGKSLCVDYYGKICIRDLAKSEEVANIVFFRDGEWIVFTQDGYYDTTPEGSSRVNWVFPGLLEAFSFEQFESAFNKPDIIRSRMAGNLEIGKPSPSITRPPQIQWPEHLALKETAEKSYRLKLFTSAIDAVSILRVFVNGKPTLEIPVGSKEKEMSLEVPLFPGANRITAIAYDTKGFSSNPKYVDVVCKRTDLPKPNLYALGIGVSKYPKLPREWQLSYAHTDAKAVIEVFKKQEGKLFGKVNSKLLFNEKASVDDIMDAFGSLEAMSESDIAVVFLAGHGIMGKNGTFYYLTSEGSLEAPEKGGISWKLLGEHLGKIKGRVIMLLDACHSGNISTETVVPNNELAHRLSSEGRSGVMVFAASKGRQSALESPDLGGGFGAFAYAITQALGLKAKEADLNNNGFVEIMELVDYVRKNVDKETEGEQTPWLSRKELFGDFAMAAVLR